MDILHSKEIEELKEKVAAQEMQLAQYRDLIHRSEQCMLESRVLSDMIAVYTRTGTFDQIFHQTLDVLSLHLEAQYFAVFWLNDDGDAFYYRHGKGYRIAESLRIPRHEGLLGRCLTENRMIVEPEITEDIPHISLGQDPAEFNVVCAPILLTRRPVGVLRMANISPGMLQSAKNVLAYVSPMLSSALDRLFFWEDCENAKQSIHTIRAIANVLEHTLGEKEILAAIWKQIPQLLPCEACVLALEGENQEIQSVQVWPEAYPLGGNAENAGEFLRKAFSALPEGNGLIEDLREVSGLAWDGCEARSLLCVPLRIRHKRCAYLLVLSPDESPYGKNETDLLNLAAIQASLTLERAANLEEAVDTLHRDPLTQLLNHRVFQERLREEIDRCNRYQKEFSLLWVDIDRFKQYNDHHGFTSGDNVLRVLGRSLGTHLRQIDRAFRFGGDELCIVLPETQSGGAMIAAKRLCQYLGEDLKSQKMNCTVSIGVAAWKNGMSPESVLLEAGKAAARSLEKGGNQAMAAEL